MRKTLKICLIHGGLWGLFLFVFVCFGGECVMFCLVSLLLGEALLIVMWLLCGSFLGVVFFLKLNFSQCLHVIGLI